MCDYSLDFVASRPAKVGDKLVSTQFRNSMTRGFASVEEPGIAVCLLPGTEIAFEKDVEYELLHRSGLIVGKVAQFRRVNPSNPHSHHDALEFPDGEIVLVTRLSEGQHATVLQLPVTARTGEEAKQEGHVSAVS